MNQPAMNNLFNLVLRKSYKKVLNELIDADVTQETMVSRLFCAFVANLLSPPQIGGTAPKAEETASAFIRLGVPKESMTISFMHVTVPLQNAVFRLHRRMCPARTVDVRWNGLSCSVPSFLSPKTLAQTLIDLDAFLPELVNKGKELINRIGVERMALHLQSITVKKQLEAVAPAMDLECRYEIVDGVVHLHLSRHYEGQKDIPLEDLPAFLANPDNIETLLSAPRAGCVEDIKYYDPFGYWRQTRQK
jgi:hypothetical protein